MSFFGRGPADYHGRGPADYHGRGPADYHGWPRLAYENARARAAQSAPSEDRFHVETSAELVELRRLWAAVHAYLIAQGVPGSGAPPNVAELSATFETLVLVHNDVYRDFVQPDEHATAIEGVSS